MSVAIWAAARANHPWASFPSANQPRERVCGREATAAVRRKVRRGTRGRTPAGNAAPGRALEMVPGAAGWCCLVLWLPACLAAHGERQRAGPCIGVGLAVHRARVLGRWGWVCVSVHGSPWGPPQVEKRADPETEAGVRRRWSPGTEAGRWACSFPRPHAKAVPLDPPPTSLIPQLAPAWGISGATSRYGKTARDMYVSVHYTGSGTQCYTWTHTHKLTPPHSWSALTRSHTRVHLHTREYAPRAHSLH